MRTTLVLDDLLLKQARHRAVDDGITLSEWVNRVLRDALREPAGPEEALDWTTFGPASGGSRPIEPEEIREALDTEDAERFGGLRT